jgi:carboxyl-terminal processing protease
MRESAESPIVGEVTSGKGFSQITFRLPNGGGIGLSTATYCLGSGHSLIGEGITPDVLIVGDTDAQLQAAIELLK